MRILFSDCQRGINISGVSIQSNDSIQIDWGNFYFSCIHRFRTAVLRVNPFWGLGESYIGNKQKKDIKIYTHRKYKMLEI
jgi:hypothetical protein